MNMQFNKTFFEHYFMCVLLMTYQTFFPKRDNDGLTLKWFREEKIGDDL